VLVLRLSACSYPKYCRCSLLYSDNATVIYPDLTAYNGVIHGIDSVLFPPSLTTSILEQLRANAQFSTFFGLLQASDNLRTLLGGSGPMTLFIPTNDAFELFDATVDSSDFTPEEIEFILEYHIALENVFLNEVPDNSSIPTLNGQNLSVSIMTTEEGEEDVRSINNATVLDGGLASNGVLYVLNKVLLPTFATDSPTSSPAPTFDGFIAPSSSPSVTPVADPIEPDNSSSGETASPTSSATNVRLSSSRVAVSWVCSLLVWGCLVQ